MKKTSWTTQQTVFLSDRTTENAPKGSGSTNVEKNSKSVTLISKVRGSRQQLAFCVTDV